jgi:hypothetical protein
MKGTNNKAAAPTIGRIWLICTTGSLRMGVMQELPVVPFCRNRRWFCFSENGLTPTPNQKRRKRSSGSR